MGFFITIIGFFGMIGYIILGAINKIRRKPKGKELKLTLMFFVLFMMGIIISPDSSEPLSKIDSEIDYDKKEIILERTLGQNKFLKENVSLLNENQISMGLYDISIVGIKVDSSSGDSIKDSIAGDGLVNETFEESTQRGFKIGFENSKAEVQNRDEYLSLYLKFKFNEENTTQRDSVIPKFKIDIIDDKGDKAKLIYNSQKDKYINTESPYAVILFKTFSDSQEFEITIEDTIYQLNKIELD